ncbi:MULTISPECIES: hypothetical protein [unclassified Afipia]|uniref:hypothetical protein n=1 Tax=unclassified Afipia TaxID=2642050 RepID=UPI0003FD57B9|nr:MULTISPECIES: hypothetical protein [unclassified Afipia]
MTARFRLEGPYGFSGAENARLTGETCAEHTARDFAYCELVVARAEMDFLRAYRKCPDGACRRARRCLGPEFSCRADNSNPRLLGFLEQGAAIDFAYDELQRMRLLRKQMREREWA